MIVTPISLCPQWAEELQKHAPHLKILHYQGWQKNKLPLVATKAKGKGKGKPATKFKGKAKVVQPEDECDDWVSYVAGFDIVLTTYAVLQADLNVAKPTVERPRRDIVSYNSQERARSPLIAVE